MRINVGIAPSALTDEHLLAEERELAMIPGTFKRIGCNNIPETMNLGNGYIKFFMDKSEYTLDRYLDVHNECLRRGFIPKDKSELWFQTNMKSNVFSWGPREKTIIKNRIVERINNSPKLYFHDNHKRISKEEAIKLLDTKG